MAVTNINIRTDNEIKAKAQEIFASGGRADKGLTTPDSSSVNHLLLILILDDVI